MSRGRGAALSLTLTLAALDGACTKNDMVDLAMHSAKRPLTHGALRVGVYEVLAGDMHCHVLPPDAPYHVSRELPETFALAKAEALDFVVLTPHVPKRFFMDPQMRAWVLATQEQLRARVARLAPELIVVQGFEYTDHEYGHVGAAFADVREVLTDVAQDDAERSPERFFESWVAHGGVLTINHPVERPLREAPFSMLRYDLSWRAFSGLPVAPEIAWITEHAQTIETFNASITHLRDQFIVGEEDRSLREAAHLVERTARTQRRRVTPVGGSDSHGSWLRATTFVLARERSQDGIRDALASGRACVRSYEACTTELRVRGGPWQVVGAALDTTGTPTPESVEARASAGPASYFVNGAHAGESAEGEAVALSVPSDRCATVRAVVGQSWSAPFYVNCPFAR